MGNFHTPLATGAKWLTTDINPPFSGLDIGLSYMKNLIVHCAGEIQYDEDTGVLSWAGTLNILFVRADGIAIRNYVSAASITLADNQFCYVDLVDTNNTARTMQKATFVGNDPSNVILPERLVLAYRNSITDKLYSVYLNPHMPNTIYKTADTTNDTTIVLISKTLQEGKAYQVIANVVARRGADAVTSMASYIRHALVSRAIGQGAVLNGLLADWISTLETDSAMDCTIDVSGNAVKLYVKGLDSVTTHWKGKMELLEV